MRKPPRILLMLNTKSNTGRGLLRGIGKFLVEHTSWDCNLTSVDPGTAHTVRKAPVDGMIIQMNSAELAEAAALRKIPIVGVGCIFPPKIPVVNIDPVAIGRIAATHLFERGFRRFAYYAYYQRPMTLLRGTAFRKTIESLGFTCDWFSLPQTPKFNLRRERQQLVAWLKSLPKPVGIFTVGDQVAREIAISCRQAGLSVPWDVAILGADNDELMCQMCHPEISSIDLGTTSAGFEAGRLLQRLLDGLPIPAETTLKPPMRIIQRESTDVITVENRRVAAAVQFIQNKIGEGANIKELVDQMDISRRTLERAFRQHLGRTIHGEVSRAQLQRVSQLLEGGQVPLAQIVAKCGMKSQSQLSNFVKKHTGLTPLEYRRTHQSKAF